MGIQGIANAAYAEPVRVSRVPRRIRPTLAQVNLPTFEVAEPSPADLTEPSRPSVDELLSRLIESLQPSQAPPAREEAPKAKRSKAPAIRRPRFIWD